MYWLPAIFSTSSLAIILFLSRNLILTRLTNAVKHEYDKKLELLRADLSRKDREIESLRQVGFSGLQQRQNILFNKQVDAIELLWAATCKLDLGKPISTMMQRLKTSEISNVITYDKKLQQFFKYISMHIDMQDLASINPLPARPFISKLAWAYYSAYSAIVWHYVVQAKLFESGLSDNLLDVEKIKTIVHVALPHQKEFIDEFGSDSLGYLLDELQDKILLELESIMNGETLDTSGLEKAAKIQKLAQELGDKNKSLSELKRL
ncbi:hypothetical protein ACSZNU_18325 [Aeromonas hydrophila]